MTAATQRRIDMRFPDWVPTAARHYLVHTETGISIRALARAQDVHASTILRQVRRFENRRDDPLVDDALRALCPFVPAEAGTLDSAAATTVELRNVAPVGPHILTDAKIDHEAARVLRRLCEQGAVLASARDMEIAVVVRHDAQGNSTRTATVPREIAQVMALRDWISCTAPGQRLARYTITATGRAELKRLLADSENRAQGLGDDTDTGRWDGEDDLRAPRQALAESPLAGLARRRDRDGQPFLSRDLVAAGERLREDFELAQIGSQTGQNWELFLTGPVPLRSGSAPEGGSRAAKDRVMAALHDLGPGLGDVALRCCCYLEGLEIAEKRLGWAARSGKIVLRIALLRLRQHYEATQGKYGPKIG